jgi:hypothetical protein
VRIVTSSFEPELIGSTGSCPIFPLIVEVRDEPVDGAELRDQLHPPF